MKKLIVLLAAMALSGGALAQQYRWVDKNGRVQYGDVPPPGVNAKALRPAPGPGSGAAPGSDARGDAGRGDAGAAATKRPLTPAEQEAEFRKRRIDAQKAQEEQAKAAEAEKAKRENCSQARQQLVTLESGQRVVRVNAKGEREFLEDADRAGEIARARKLVSDWCN